MTRSTGWAVCTVIGAALALAPPARAAHPLQTEDTGTQGTGNVEWENGFSRTRTDAATTVVYQPQFSLGLTPSLDLIAQPSWLRRRDATDATTRGLGDTNLDAKWRFYGDAPLSLGIRAGVMVATNEHGLGLPRGDASPHAVLIATYDAAPFTVHANVGLARFPANSGLRRGVGQVSAAVMWATSERWILTVDAGAMANPDPNRSTWPATLLAGAIYTARPGLDLDVGYQSSVHGSVATRQWLAGVTYRFAP